MLLTARRARSRFLPTTSVIATVAWLVPGVLVGGLLGSRVAIGLEGDVLRWCVAAYCYVVAAQMLLGRRRQAAGGDVVPRGIAYSAAGAGIGALSAIVGIGGSMTVPLLVWRGLAPVVAVGTSSATGIFIGLGGVLGYALQAPAGALPLAGSIGYVYLPAALSVAIASVLAAPYGTRLAHALSGDSLKRVFAGFLVLVGSSVAYGAL